MGRLEKYRRDWWVPRRAKLLVRWLISRGRGGDIVQRSARKTPAEHTAHFQTSTDPFYAARREYAAPRTVSVEFRPETPGSAVQPRRAPAADATARQHTSGLGARRPNQRNRPAKGPRGRAPGTERAREQNFREPTNSPVHPRRRHTQLFTSLCAWKRAQNLAFSRTSHS